MNAVYSRPGINFYTQQKTVTSFWTVKDAVSRKTSVPMRTPQ